MSNVTLHFYEKPGCINNTRQKQMLRKTGIELVEHNLLTTPWQREELRRFFGKRPVAEWFNPSAPAVKNRRIRPNEMTSADALDVMLADPILIRRPLLQSGDWYESGFDWPQLVECLNLTEKEIVAIEISEGIDGCAHENSTMTGLIDRRK
ncbi:ArsC/Spx/MgsR family protein [Thalassolituus sp.]|uniref:ArsC/Spx/MgsR family protein n=1 Tax=Thalassolituus sp. TaxID=2030822 RepID=UPI002A827511|nr:ArsC/Spx/MgsR family protein [Thalassolituus sp.]